MPPGNDPARPHRRRLTPNRMGWSSEQLSEVGEAFAAAASLPGSVVLDVGSGHGVAALAALSGGAIVVANDLTSEILNSIETRAQAVGPLDRLQLVRGRFPGEIDFDDGTFTAIHAANVLHFLTPRLLESGLRKIHRWLRPDGRFFALAATPYLGPFASFAPEYRRRLEQGELWPGWVARTRDFSRHRLLSQMPSAIHLLDDTILKRAAEDAGLEVESVRMFQRRDLPLSLAHDGRESVGLVAFRPVKEPG